MNSIQPAHTGQALVSKEAWKLNTPRERKIIEAGASIALEPAESEDLAFTHSILCQVGLPRSRVDGIEFERRSGGAGLLIKAGKLWDGAQFIQQPIPYGPMPRLMLAWINTQAIRSGAPEISVGSSANEFIRILGKTPNGGRNSVHATFRKQLRALAACSLTLGFNVQGTPHTYEGKPIKHFEAWKRDGDQQPQLWPGAITLSDEYFQTLKRHAVPLDLRAYQALDRSALAMDLYTWAAQRLHRIQGRSIELSWAKLRDQFGQEYQGINPIKDFKKKFLQEWRAVQAVYPKARVKQVEGGISLMYSPPPIPYSGA